MIDRQYKHVSDQDSGGGFTPTQAWWDIKVNKMLNDDDWLESSVFVYHL